MHLALRKFCISSLKPLQSPAVSQYGQCLDPLPLEWCYPRSPPGCQLLKKCTERKWVQRVRILCIRVSHFVCTSALQRPVHGEVLGNEARFRHHLNPRQLVQQFIQQSQIKHHDQRWYCNIISLLDIISKINDIVLNQCDIIRENHPTAPCQPGTMPNP